MTVKVVKAVAEGIEAVRSSGKTNMFDRRSVAILCWDWGYYEAHNWVDANPKTYAKLVFAGLEIAGESDRD